jgi:hypothetical protein
MFHVEQSRPIDATVEILHVEQSLAPGLNTQHDVEQECSTWNNLRGWQLQVEYAQRGAMDTPGLGKPDWASATYGRMLHVEQSCMPSGSRLRCSTWNNR